jgi:fumarylacetoacetate (FAA) hydrolase
MAPTCCSAIEQWDTLRPQLQQLSDALNAGRAPRAVAFEPARCMAPLPRSFQWCDASAFLNHGRLMERAFNTAPIPDFETIPVMYQGASDDFLGPQRRADAGRGARDRLRRRIRRHCRQSADGRHAARGARMRALLVQLNDWSLRASARAK